MSNSSSITEFLLLAFADTRQLQLLHFWLFLGIYLAALLGNGLIITSVACDHRLHTPMYFFLLNLSLLDLGSISTTVPQSMANSLWDTRAISYWECAAQVFFFLFLFTAEYCVLTIMAYDRYIAICKPLHYGTLLGSRACVHMAAAAWASGFLYAVMHTANTFSLPLCQGNAVDQFFCEIPQILKFSCSRSYLREVGILVLSACLAFGCFVFILFSYVQIFRAVLRIPSEQGRHKAFSTCLPHLAVVSLFVSTGMFAYLKPPSLTSPSLNLVVAVLYTVVPPAVNPLLYSMRNQELKDALRKWIQCVHLQQQVERRGRLGPVSGLALREVLTQKAHDFAAVLQSLCPAYVLETTFPIPCVKPYPKSHPKRKILSQVSAHGHHLSPSELGIECFHRPSSEPMQTPQYISLLGASHHVLAGQSQGTLVRPHSETTDAKHSTLGAAMKKVKSVPARPGTMMFSQSRCEELAWGQGQKERTKHIEVKKQKGKKGKFLMRLKAEKTYHGAGSEEIPDQSDLTVKFSLLKSDHGNPTSSRELDSMIFLGRFQPYNTCALHHDNK
ncbi:olfactory receptor 14J1-like [Morphnus guianensis]